MREVATPSLSPIAAQTPNACHSTKSLKRFMNPNLLKSGVKNKRTVGVAPAVGSVQSRNARTINRKPHLF
jgi:hypothetical protein